jgi:ribosomal protein S18 acetylase RimI-like enzyme
MDDGTLRQRLWLGFARLQTLLGGQAAGGVVIERPGVVASIVPAAPESPTLNAAIAMADDLDPALLRELHDLYRDAGVRRWGVWTDAGGHRVIEALEAFKLRLSTSSPGMAAAIDELDLDGHAGGVTADLATVGRVNDMAYGNPDSRLERTLAPLAPGPLRGYRADHDGHPASVALALHHDGDCGVSFVATAPQARRRGLARDVMARVAVEARADGCTSASLQATDLGEKLYAALGYRIVSDMQLWERRT